jgi:glucosamine kinase
MAARILIGDIGSTSGKWVIHDSGGQQTFRTPGYNPVSQGEEAWGRMREMLRSNCASAAKVLYYGTGVISQNEVAQIRSRLKKLYPLAYVEVASDLLAAARAICGNQPGIIAILGTGSSACSYDGNKITRTLPSLGYPLGDEGGGWRIGLEMVRGYYYRTMPEDLRPAFASQLPPDKSTFLTQVQESNAPNAYLGRFASFASSNARHPWVQDRLLQRFEEFIRGGRNVFGEGPVHCSGGIAQQFEEQLRAVFEAQGIRCGKIIGEPLPYLLTFHTTPDE